jgi:hypothetical protein
LNSQVEHTLPVLVGLHTNKLKHDEAETRIKNMQCAVKNAVWKKVDALERQFKVMTKYENIFHCSRISKVNHSPFSIYWEMNACLDISKKTD